MLIKCINYHSKKRILRKEAVPMLINLESKRVANKQRKKRRVNIKYSIIANLDMWYIVYLLINFVYFDYKCKDS